MVSNSKLKYWFEHVAYHHEHNQGLHCAFPAGGKWCLTDTYSCFFLDDAPDGITLSDKIVVNVIDINEQQMREQDPHGIECEIITEVFTNRSGDKVKICKVGQAFYDARRLKAILAVFGKHYRLYTRDNCWRDWLWVYPTDRYGEVDFQNFAFLCPRKWDATGWTKQEVA